MGALGDIMKHRAACLLISAILGFGLAAAFFRVCQGRDCVVYTGPSTEYVTSNVWRDGKECYKYSVKAAECPNRDTEEVDSGKVAVAVGGGAK
jgi:hypothetical protein